jgi:aminoglycoside phosphotransferase (APT) family kinase protein
VSVAAVIAPVRRDLDAVSDKLAGWLAARMGTPGLIVTDLSYPLGAGLSNETILLEASWDEDGHTKHEGFVIRLEPSSYRVYMDVDFEGQFRLQSALRETGIVPVPEMLWFEHDVELLGARFFAMRRLRGHVAVSHPPYATHGWVAAATPEQRHTIWHNGVTALALLSKIPTETVAMLDRPQYAASGWDQEWAYWMKSYDWARGGRSLPVCEQTIDWLKANMPTERESGLCWGDARIGNLMYDDSFSVIAVMDWEGATLGGGLQDLGFWRFLDDISALLTGVRLEGFGSREETIALWEEVSGLPAADVGWYEVFGGFKLACHIARKLELDGNSRPGFNYGDNPATRILAESLGLPQPKEQH